MSAGDRPSALEGRASDLTPLTVDRLTPGEVPAGSAELWFTERMFAQAGYALRIKRTLHAEQTRFQRIDLFESFHHGRVLALDGCVMLTELDEFIYHELLTHTAAQTLEAPRRAVVVGGGDGGAVRELLKYPELEVTLAEIDERVVRISQEFLPATSACLTDPRVTLAFEDGAEFLARSESGSLDLVVVDGTDPVGAAGALVTDSFYGRAAGALADHGVFVQQTQSPFYHPGEIRRIYAGLSRAFPHVWMFWGVCPSYLGAFWTFCYASRARHPLDHLGSASLAPEALGAEYYSHGVHRGAFALPPFARRCLPEGHPQRAADA